LNVTEEECREFLLTMGDLHPWGPFQSGHILVAHGEIVAATSSIEIMCLVYVLEERLKDAIAAIERGVI